ncbi:MAG: DMT family transporter [Pseudomonadota bacterium]
MPQPPAPGAPRKDRIDLTGAVMLIWFSALMGLNQPLIKLVNTGLAPVFQAGLRSACAILPVLLYAWLTRKRLGFGGGTLGPGLICGVLFSVEFVMLFTALEFTTASRSAIFFYTMPFWLALGAHVLIPGERLTPIRLLGLGLAIAGVAVALADWGTQAGPDAWIGDLLCLAAALCWAVLALMMRTTALARTSPEMQLLYQLGISAVLLLALAPFLGPLVREMTPALAGIFAFQVLAVVSFGFLGWFWVLSIYPPAKMASFSFLAPVFGVGFGWLILGEALRPSLLVALALVGVGIYLVNRRSDRPGR